MTAPNKIEAGKTKELPGFNYEGHEDEDETGCVVCGVANRSIAGRYCGASCPQADEEGIA